MTAVDRTVTVGRRAVSPVPTHHAEALLSRLLDGVGTLHRLPATGHLSIQRHTGAVLDALTLPR